MKSYRRFLLIAAAAAVTAIAAGQSDSVNKDSHGVAIKGYDPVAYFTDSKPVKGSPEFAYSYMGATYQFSSAAHRDEFVKTPEKYVPQYGGYCAYGVSQNHTAPIDPEAWTIVEGKLYLNYSKAVKKTWSEAIPGYIQAADKNWPGLHK